MNEQHCTLHYYSWYSTLRSWAKKNLSEWTLSDYRVKCLSTLSIINYKILLAVQPSPTDSLNKLGTFLSSLFSVTLFRSENDRLNNLKCRLIKHDNTNSTTIERNLKLNWECNLLRNVRVVGEKYSGSIIRTFPLQHAETTEFVNTKNEPYHPLIIIITLS